VPTRDGVVLGATLNRPATEAGAATGPFPGLVVEVTPYALMADLHLGEAAYFTERGYVTLICTVRGAGRSGGTWGHAFWAQDGRDAHDAVEWLAAQPFCDGRVGQVGESYGGQTSYGSAVERPPHLRAIAPMQAPGSLYDDVIYPGGIKSTEGGLIDSWPPIAEIITEGAVDPVTEFAANRAHPTFDQYWQDRSLAGRYQDIEVPVLALGGYQDQYFRSGTMDNIEGALERTWAIYGPWPHLPPVEIAVGFSAPDPLPGGVLLAWFDHWVHELAEVPIPPEPTFVSFEGPIGTGRGWRELDGWDPAGRHPEVWTLAADGVLTPPDPPNLPSPTRQPSPDGESVHFAEPSEPTDPGGSVTFTSAPLADDRVLLGRAGLGLVATLSAGEAHLYVELLDVDTDGQEVLVNDGFLAASHRRSHTHPEPAPVGQELTLHVAIRPAHHRFVAGHSVRLRVSGGGQERLTPPPEAVEIRIATAASTLRLPGFAQAHVGPDHH
jgi:uncharacterized protein